VGYNAVMDESAIATASERDKMFKQVEGFKSKIVDSATADCVANGLPATCKRYTDKAGSFYLYNYPDDDTVQYLHETYPKQISPLEGITNEHFMIWMRTSALPTFRKLYGRIYRDFKKGEAVTFEVEANFEVRSFNADKAIIITKQGQFGAKNSGLGIAYITIGSMCLFFGFLFTVKQLILPRPLGTRKALGWGN
jgi:LEM3 (ligand-effect modulator 3) family / CDC50 family